MSEKVQPTEKLSPEQVQALAALLSNPTIEKAAAVAKISSKQLSRWINDDPDFQAALLQAETEMIDQAVRRLAAVSAVALDTLESIIKNKRAAAGVRVRASTVVLEQLVRLRELHQFEQRLAKLEEGTNARD